MVVFSTFLGVTCVSFLFQIQIGCQTDHLTASELKRAPCVHQRFAVTSEMMQVCNLWGGLVYVIAPAKTQVHELEVVVQIAVPAPYYKCGKCLVSGSVHSLQKIFQHIHLTCSFRCDNKQ